jgi:hypothetical protein
MAVPVQERPSLNTRQMVRENRSANLTSQRQWHKQEFFSMAKVINNIFVRGLSGSLGDQFIVKTYKSGHTVICKKPTFESNRTFSQAQKAHQQAFREAAAYAKQMKGEEIYITLAKRMAKIPYNLALSDWFNPPEVLEIDLSDWCGQAGQVIRMRAQDDVLVQHVRVTITDEVGTVLEQGPAVEAGALWWEYMTTATASGKVEVKATALDLPGHKTEMSQQITFAQ